MAMKEISLTWLHSLNVVGLSTGLFAIRIDYRKQMMYESKFIAYYDTILSILTVALLPYAHTLTVNYITSKYKHKLLAFTDLLNMFIKYIAIVFTAATRWRREAVFRELTQQIFDLDLSYFSKLPKNAKIENSADMILLVKMIIFTLELYVPVHNVLRQATGQVDGYWIGLAVYTSFTEFMLHAVIFVFFLLSWQLRMRVWRINARLKELLRSLQKLHRNADGVLAPPVQDNDSGTLRQLSALAAEELREIAGVYARFSAMLLRLNAAFKWQVIAVLLTFLIGNISYGYAWVLALQNIAQNAEHKYSVWSLLASLLGSAIVFIDINLLYWAAYATTCAYQKTGQIMRCFQVLPLMDVTFERQCESFALQLKQEKMDISIAGMFNVNRTTALALWSYQLRQVLLLVQFDFDKSYRTSVVLEEVNRFFEYGEL